MADHVFHRDGQRAIVAEHGHAEAVADEDHVDTGFFLKIGGRVIVAGQPGDRFIFGSLIKKGAQGYFLTFGHLNHSLSSSFCGAYKLYNARVISTSDFLHIPAPATGQRSERPHLIAAGNG